jgi:hypothetical protein
VRRLCADSSQARAVLGYEARVPLQQGLAELLGWYRAQNVSPETLLEREVVRNWDMTVS